MPGFPFEGCVRQFCKAGRWGRCGAVGWRRTQDVKDCAGARILSFSVSLVPGAHSRTRSQDVRTASWTRWKIPSGTYLPRLLSRGDHRNDHRRQHGRERKQKRSRIWSILCKGPWLRPTSATIWRKDISHGKNWNRYCEGWRWKTRRSKRELLRS